LMVDNGQTQGGCIIHLATPIKFQLDPKNPLPTGSKAQGFTSDSIGSGWITYL